MVSTETVLFVCTFSDDALFLQHVAQKYLKRVRVMARTRFQSYGHNSVEIVRGFTVLVLCTSFNHALHLYQVSRNDLERSEL